MEPKETDEPDEPEEIEALTMRDLITLRRFVQNLELEFRGGDIVLWARYQEPEDEGSDRFMGEAIAKIGIREVAASSTGELIGEDDDDKEEKRDAMFALAGRLREAAALIEQEAMSLSEHDWDPKTGHVLELM
jgi:hypothetical protein